MKAPLTKLLSLLLVTLLALGPCCLAEEGIAVEDAFDQEPIAIDDALILDTALDEFALDASFDDLNQAIIDLEQQPSDESAQAKPSQEEAEEEEEPSANASNAVTIGVKEKYTLDSSRLSGRKTFKSSNGKVAVVTQKGVVIGQKVGNAKITIKSSQGQQLVVKITVKKAPSKVTMSKTKASLKPGNTLQLKAKLPSGSASKKLVWSSSNKSVATVNAAGKVTAVAAGTATITVKTFNGRKATCKITVKSSATVLKVKPTSLSLNVDQSADVTVTYTEYGTIRYSIGNEDIVKCAWSGSWSGDNTKLTVTGLSAGTTTVTISDDNNHSARFSVTVKEAQASTFDLFNIYLESIDDANDMLPDKLSDLGDNFYGNNYFVVQANSGTIIAVLLGNGGNGRYTLMGVYPGMSSSSASSVLSSYGWSFYGSSEDTYFYTHSSLSYTAIAVKITSGVVENVMIMLTDI